MLTNVEKFGISDKRGRKMTHDDPFSPETGLPGVNICKTCHAIYHKKTWKRDPDLYEKCLMGIFSWTVCPACLKLEENAPQGFMTLSGSYLDNHRKEILNGLLKTAAEASRANPLERILNESEEDGTLLIETTTVKLAERLGRALNRAHQGEMEISWTGDPPTCRVNWRRG